MKKTNQRKRIPALLLVLTILCTCPSPGLTARAAAGDSPAGKPKDASLPRPSLGSMKAAAIRYLQSTRNPDGSYGDNRLPRDTCEVETLLRETGTASDRTWIQEQGQQWTADNDSLARLYLATEDEAYLAMLPPANADGGYGLTAHYESDILDTLLVASALLLHDIQTGGEKERLEQTTAYFKSCQNEDGGFSYLPDTDSDYLLSARIGCLLALHERQENQALTLPVTEQAQNRPAVPPASENAPDHSHTLETLDAYLAQSAGEAGTDNLKETTNFRETMAGLTYRCLRGTLPGDAPCKDTAALEQTLSGLQKPDGSFGDTLQDTIAAVWLLQAMEEESKPRLTIQNIQTSLSSYTAWAGYETPVTVTTDITCQCNHPYPLTWKSELFLNGEAVTACTREIETRARETQAACSGTLKIKARPGDTCTIRTTVFLEDTLLHEQEDTIHITELTVDDLELAAEASGEGGTKLSWNSLDNDFCRYGYRVCRSTDGENWESISSWDGAETVKVLNIYPCEAAKNYLKTWMDTGLQGEGTPAGKDLFEIDTVNIDAYNQKPEAYLLDGTGEYRYDVLFFGAYNANAYKDLSEASCLATRKFADAGRGVLFGHDTVTLADTVYHQNFAEFAAPLGIKLKTGPGWMLSSRVRVVNSGLLTSYPWRIEGTLTIPATHTYQQYVGGTLPATQWMELTGPCYTDEETGGRTDSYLCTRNQLGLIQTGNSNGAATDDERKVLANTLFYLKQLTAATTLTDRWARDLTPPGPCQAEVTAGEEEQLTITVTARDYGTQYAYCVEALPRTADAEELKRTSNVAWTETVSGIRGYEIRIGTSGNTNPEAPWELLETTAETAELTLPETLLPDTKEPLCLHIRAVDRHGNRGEETTVPLPEKQTPEPPDEGTVLFAAQNLTVHGGTLLVDGKTHAGGDILLTGSAVRMTQACSASGQIHAYTGQCVMADRQENAGTQEMPQLEAAILQSLENCRQENRLDCYGSVEIREPVFCAGTASFYCPEAALTENLVCAGDIRFGAEEVTLGLKRDITLYSADGNITINASRCSGRGIIYAPNGTVTVNGSDFRFEGCILAREIILQGTSIEIS